MPLADSYDATTGGSGGIEAYGLRANRVPTSGLYKADVSVLGESAEAYGGGAIHLEGVNGSSNHGDSGGPLIVNGQIVGVCSTGDSADPASEIHTGSNYANLTASRQWITDVTGVCRLIDADPALMQRPSARNTRADGFVAPGSGDGVCASASSCERRSPSAAHRRISRGHEGSHVGHGARASRADDNGGPPVGDGAPGAAGRDGRWRRRVTPSWTASARRTTRAPQPLGLRGTRRYAVGG